MDALIKNYAPRGFCCTTCGEFHTFSMYVHAHVHDLLVHNCNRCGARHEVMGYVAVQTKPGSAPFDE